VDAENAQAALTDIKGRVARAQAEGNDPWTVINECAAVRNLDKST
jgi:hypothetical protein